jgi:hypothetical protein
VLGAEPIQNIIHWNIMKFNNGTNDKGTDHWHLDLVCQSGASNFNTEYETAI